jgi:hypothetical protein
MTTPEDEVSNKKYITEEEVDKAQQAWCDGLVEISEAYRNGGDYRALAEKFIDDMYDFKEGRVFFRPTLAAAPRNFRTTREGALSYFIGGNSNFPEDDGFAKKPWAGARYDNAIEGSNAIQIFGNIAMTMGNVYLQPEVSTDGKEVVVDKVFAFRKDKKGKLRLIVHKSALTNMPKDDDGSEC